MQFLECGARGLMRISEALDCLCRASPLSLDIETYSPQGFPYDAEDLIVSVSLARPLCGNPRWWVEISSVICHPSLEPRLLKTLSSQLDSRIEGPLLTYNGLRFDLPYLEARARRFGIDLARNLERIPHIDLYRLIRGLGICLPNHRQKDVEEFLGIRRRVKDVNGSNYYIHYQNFLKNGDIKPIIYNIEDALLMQIILFILKQRLKINSNGGAIIEHRIHKENKEMKNINHKIKISKPLYVLKHKDLMENLLNEKRISSRGGNIHA